jgi:hypothetical protein
MMRNVKPAWFNPKPRAPEPKLTAADREAKAAARTAFTLDCVNLAHMKSGLPVHPEARREFYPIGYGPGQMLPAGPDRPAVAAYVDAA